MQLPRPTLVLTVGPAASGKSTLLRRLLRDGVVQQVVSTDGIRAELGLAPDETETAYATARGRVLDALRAGSSVAVDATNVRAQDRAVWRVVGALGGATEVVALRVGVGLTLEELVDRDAGRERHVPSEVIAEQVELADRSGAAVLLAEGLSVLDARDLAPTG